MEKLLQEMMAALDVEKSADHVRWLTDHTPSRISGMGQDREAAEYICKKIEEYGLESKILEFEAYNSHPGTSKVKIVAPVQKEISSIACCHIESTPVGGADYEVVYLGSGGEEDYVGKDVAGKAVLVEVSYAPATPEKAMLASEHHAAAMICMNWGTAEHELICNRGLKAVWGNPTPESFGKIPQIVGISITRKDGEYLKELCLSGEKVVLHMDVQSQREWQTLPQPMGILRGTEEPEKFLLVSAHLDAWCPGVTCNATGDGTMLEMMRVSASSGIKSSGVFTLSTGTAMKSQRLLVLHGSKTTFMKTSATTVSVISILTPPVCGGRKIWNRCISRAFGLCVRDDPRCTG